MTSFTFDPMKLGTSSLFYLFGKDSLHFALRATPCFACFLQLSKRRLASTSSLVQDGINILDQILLI